MKMFKCEDEYKHVFTKDYFVKSYQELGVVTRKEKLCIIPVVVAFVAFVLQGKTGMSVSGCFALAIFACFIPGLSIADEQALKGINFNLFFMAGGCLAIGVVANACGAGAMVADFMRQFVLDSIYGCTFSVFGIGYILNFLLTPSAATAVFGGPLASVAVSYGFNPVAIAYIFVQGLNNLLLPYEGPMYMLCFAFGYMTTKQFAKFATVKLFVMWIWVLVFAIPWWKMLGIFYL